MTSRYGITERAASTGGSMTWFASQSRQPLFANSKRHLWHHVQLTMPQWGITKAGGLSNTLRVQKGQRAEKGDTVTYISQEHNILSHIWSCSFRYRQFRA